MAAVAARAAPVISTDMNADTCPMGAARPAKLFIGGITRHTTTKQLRDHFARYGRVLDCVAMRQPDGRPRGFGYVTLDSPAAADRCLAEPQVVDGRVVDMKRAVPEGSEGPGGYQAGHAHFAQDFYMGQHHPSMLGYPSMEFPGMLPPEMIYGAVTTPTGAGGHHWGHQAMLPEAPPSLPRSKAALETPDCVELLRGGRAPRAALAFAPFSAPPTPTGASTGMLNAGAAEFVPMGLPQKVVQEAGKRRSPLQPRTFANDENLPAAQAAITEVMKVDLSENQPKPQESQQTAKPKRAVLGEITNIANAVGLASANEQIKKSGDLAKPDGAGKGIFAGSENAGKSDQENVAPNVVGLKLTSTRPPALGLAEFDICLDEEAEEKSAAQAVVPDDDSEGGQSEQAAHQCSAPGHECTEDCELPSIGSAEHAAGTCKRCNFFPKGRCQNGKDCTFCHFAHDKRKPSRQEKRERRAAWLAQRGEGEVYPYDDDDDEEEGEEYGDFQQTMAYSILPGLPPMRAAKLPPALALPGAGMAGFGCMPPPGLAPQHAAPPMLASLDEWMVDQEAPMSVRCSPTSAAMPAQRSMSVLSTVPMSTPHSLAPSPTGSHAAAFFAGCSAPPTPSGAAMALATSPMGAYAGKVMCTIATQTERALCQQCGDKEKCKCASSPPGENMWSREEMLRVREAQAPGGEPAALRTVAAASLECQ